MKCLAHITVIENTARSPLHLADDATLKEAAVGLSRWYDFRWDFESDIAGSRRIKNINWSVMMPDGSRLTDSEHERTLNIWKRVFWGNFVSKNWATGTIGSKASGLRWLIPRLAESYVFLPQEITKEVSNDILDELFKEASDNDDENEESGAVVMNRLNALAMLWDQRFDLEKVGIKPMPDNPFPKGGVNYYAKRIVKLTRGQFMPLPDEVALPILNMAWKFLDKPAEDIINLHDIYLAAYNREAKEFRGMGDGTNPHSRKERARRAIRDFKFSCVAGAKEPWHAPLGENRAGQQFIGGAQRLRQLFMHVRSAATLVLQASTGMRISEICGLSAGIDDETGLPNGVIIRESESGFLEHFIIRSKIFKTGPREVEWNLGSRPSGSDTEPPSIRAIKVLNRLLEYYRVLAETADLLIGFDSARGFPKKRTSVNKILSSNVMNGYRNLIEEFVDLSNLGLVDKLIGPEACCGDLHEAQVAL